jgi:predicted nicotinamide N-methyase
MRPAYETKNVPILSYSFNEKIYQLQQSDSSGATGSTLWLSTQLLACYLTTLHQSRRKALQGQVLELGSGIGLLGLILRDLGCNMTVSDYAAIMPLLEANIASNPPLEACSGSLETIKLDWTALDSSDTRIFDTIVLADVIYSPILIEPLLRTLLKYARRGSTAYLAQEVRTPHLLQEFINLCLSYFKVTRLSESEMAKIESQLASLNSEVETCDQEDEKECWSGVDIYKMTRKC